MTLWAAFALIAIGILAVYLEFFVPAFGVIGIGGILMIIATVFFAYRDLPDLQATIILLTALFVTPTAIIFLLRRFPKSFLGRRLILRTQLTPEPPSQRDGTGSEPTTLVGMRGTTLTPLHPSGLALIAGSRYSVVTNGEYLEQATPVVITQHFGSRIVVRRAPTDVDTNTDSNTANRKEPNASTPEGGSHDD